MQARHAAVAALRTCASVAGGSTISSVTTATGTGSSQLTTGRRSARNDSDPNVVSTAEDSDSDDGDDVDEEDNSWQTSPPHQRDDDNLPCDQFAYDDEGEEESKGPPQTDYLKRLKQLEWKFKKIDEDETPWDVRPMFDGPEDASLRPGVSDQFNDPFECFQVVGGLDKSFMARLTRNSNSYFHNNVKKELTNKHFHGKRWHDIKIPEMCRFFGIMLRISISPVDGGGCTACFSTRNVTVEHSNARKPEETLDTEGFAAKCMPVHRFKQMRSAFHPEEKASAGGADKCYQLRHLIEKFNAHSKASFLCGRESAFDEGGVGCRSRMCPCRQHNGSKPQKFRVDFFIWACAKTYAVLHLDVYQGKNGSNVGIHPSIHELPTTQKAVMNAGLSLGLHKLDDGARHCTFDNRYGAPELLVLALEVLNCYCTATNRSNRVGWDKQLMTLAKKDGKGTYLLTADKINRVLATQWVDSKVVNVISTLNYSSVGKVFRRVGAIRKEVDCPDVVRKYQQTMFGVDKGDQIRMHGGGFARKAHFQKWHKRAFFAIVDCMLLNSLIAWNMSAGIGRTHKQRLKRHQYLMYIAQRLLDFPDDEREAEIGEEMSIATMSTGNHIPLEASGRDVKCCVCRLEHNMNSKVGSAGMSDKSVATCSDCGIPAHALLKKAPGRIIHTLPQFHNVTCFQIAHSKDGRATWERSTTKTSYLPKLSHSIVMDLRERHGLPRKKSGSRASKQCSVENNDSNP